MEGAEQKGMSRLGRAKDAAQKTKPILQVVAKIEGADREVSAQLARRHAIGWMETRAGQLPSAAFKHDSFELDLPGKPASAVRFKTDQIDYWVGRLDDPDKVVAGRIWTTEITVPLTSNDVRFRVRQQQAARENTADIIPFVPSVVRATAEDVGLAIDGRSLTVDPWAVATEEDVESLVDLISSPSRRLPIYVASLAHDEDDSGSAAVNVLELSRRCIGLAHVVVLAASMTRVLESSVGKAFSVFNGAVRTYRQNCDLYSDNPFSHPLALPQTILNWGTGGTTEFTNLLIRRAAEDSANRINQERELPSQANVRNVNAQMQREMASARGESDTELLALADIEIDALKAEVQIWQQTAIDEDRGRQDALERVEELEGQAYWLRQRVREIEDRLNSFASARQIGEPDIPDSFDSLNDWAAKNLVGRVVVTKKAIRAAKGAEFVNVTLGYRALLLLANEYRDMRLGRENSVERFNSQLMALGLENSRTGEESKLWEEGDEFTVDWRGSRALLAWHLKNGNTRDPKRCFRLYYFWDDETEQVVVGSMPAHLHTRAT